MNLQIEKYIFQIIENQKRLNDYLGEYRWEFDMVQGILAFSGKSGDLIAKCPVQIIGTEGYGANTWMWGWANEKSGIPQRLLLAVNRIKKEAEKNNEEIFLKPEITLSKNLGAKLAIICAGFLNHFTYFSCSYKGGCMYVTIENSPIKKEEPKNLPLVLNTIQTAISSFEFNHRNALLSYLGNNPEKIGNNILKWVFEKGSITVEFDEKDRIAKINSSN